MCVSLSAYISVCIYVSQYVCACICECVYMYVLCLCALMCMNVLMGVRQPQMSFLRKLCTFVFMTRLVWHLLLYCPESSRDPPALTSPGDGSVGFFLPLCCRDPPALTSPRGWQCGLLSIPVLQRSTCSRLPTGMEVWASFYPPVLQRSTCPRLPRGWNPCPLFLL